MAASAFSSHRSCLYGAQAEDRQKARREKRQVLFRKVPLQDDCRDREFDDSCNDGRGCVAPLSRLAAALLGVGRRRQLPFTGRRESDGEIDDTISVRQFKTSSPLKPQMPSLI
jgi:hypothetical protein